MDFVFGVWFFSLWVGLCLGGLYVCEVLVGFGIVLVLCVCGYLLECGLEVCGRFGWRVMEVGGSWVGIWCVCMMVVGCVLGYFVGLCGWVWCGWVVGGWGDFGSCGL